jgi:transcriptional regulator with XRE-family HTH domain
VKSFGKQPAHAILRAQGRTITGTARAIGVNPSHMHYALRGKVRPSVRIREKLPALLGIPLSELFDEEPLSLPFDGRMSA